METIYYNIDVKQLKISGENATEKASGGQETVYCLPRQRGYAEPRQPEGRLLNMEDYRLRMTEDATPIDKEPCDIAPEPLPRKWSRLGPTLEGCATGAIICLVIGMLVRIFFT